ncbi:MAG: succinate dehydrogenase, hydrophobic membrane anchor protein [Betaproteobacteria bacterium]|nr:succinate dehydrogenase, hydrophobic membrane anchor protein [Betaproteobacteria bacterium]MDH3435751.1 succinate dehydrogenase, hydrophobic membrane anchor protein [Betaproteobacteria bacterium]
MVKREVVGAHYGLREWLAQRITAVVMAIYTLLLVLVFVRVPVVDFWHWQALWKLPVMRYATVLFLLSVYYHAWIGLRDIFMDYIKDPGLRLALYVIVISALVCYTVWSVQILWSL